LSEIYKDDQNEVKTHLDMLHDEKVLESENSKVTFIDLFNDQNLKRTMIAIGVMSFFEFTGIHAITYYTIQIFLGFDVANAV